MLPVDSRKKNPTSQNNHLGNGERAMSPSVCYQREVEGEVHWHLSLIDCWADIKYKHSNCSVYLSGLYMEHTYTSCKNISILCTFIDILQILSRCKVKPIDNWPVAWGMRAWTYDLCWFMFYFYLNILKHIHFEWHILSKHS